MSKDITNELRDQIYAVAEDRGYAVIEKNLDLIIKGLVKRNEKFGGYYCPCRLVRDDAEWKEKITCPCAFLDDEIVEKGECHCRLYKKL